MENPITIETARPDAPENAVTAACLGSCSILGGLGPEQQMQILRICAETTQMFCSGPREGQKGPICGQRSEDAKSTMMREVRAARV